MKILLHMPHTKLRLPKIFYRGLLIDKNELNKYNLIMSDVGVDELFKGIKAYKIQSKYSRLYCDVEKFKDDNLEIMSKYGQGVIYTHTPLIKLDFMNMMKNIKERYLSIISNITRN